MSLVIYEVCKKEPKQRTHYGIEVFLNHEAAKKHLRELNAISNNRLFRQYHKLSGTGRNSKDYFEAQRIQHKITEGT
tara:strand:+ start:787 stop:1017 length:231 start_codon:yes stop_codon:yes gene_type:complete